MAEQKDAETLSTGKISNKYNNRRILSLSPWENYSSSIYLPATNPTTSVKAWAAAHSEADQQLRLIADLFDTIQKEVKINSIKYEL